MYTNKAYILMTCSSRTLSLFTRCHIPRVFLSHSSILLSSQLERKPRNSSCVIESRLALGTTLLKGKAGSSFPLMQKAYYKTKAEVPVPFQVQLNKKIISLKTVQDQLSLYDSESFMNVVNRVSLLFNIARIVARDKRQLHLFRKIKSESHALSGSYIRLLDSLSADISRCSPRCLANMMWSLGKIEEKSHCLLQICEETILSCDLISFTQPDIFQIVKGCSLLGIQGNKIFLKLEEAILNGEIAISDFKDRDLTLVVMSFAKNESGSETLFNHFQSEILARDLTAYESRQLAGFVWSFAKQTLSCSSDLFDQIESEVLRRGTKTVQNVPTLMLLWSFAKMGLGSERLFSAFDSNLVARGLQAFATTGVVQLVWSFAKRGLKDAGLYAVVENEVLARGMSVFQDYQLVVLLWSFTKAEKFDTELVRNVSHEFLQRDVKQLRGDHLSQLAWTLGRAGIKMPELFDSIGQVVKNCPPDMTSSQLIALIRGFVEAKEGSSELFDYFRLALLKDIKALSADNICEVLWCFSECKSPSNRPDVFSTIAKEILCRGIASFNTVQLAKIKQCFLAVKEGSDCSEQLLEMLQNVDIDDKDAQEENTS